VREWTITLPSELPFWELESRWIPKSLENDRKGQNPLDWEVLHIIGNFLELRCLKWACMNHLDTSNTSYGQKKGRESNWQFDSRPLKVGNHPDFLMCRWRATYLWKALDNSYNFALDLISIGGLDAKLWVLKVTRVPTLGPKSELWWVLWIQVCLWLVLTSKVLKLCTNQLVVWFV
jgi:hypothetical protein